MVAAGIPQKSATASGANSRARRSRMRPAAGAALQWPAWKSFFKVQLAYAYAARLPVAAVMAFATRAGWSSHYTAVVPGESTLESFMLFGFIPQLVWWVSFTVIVGALFGAVAAAFAGYLRSPKRLPRR